MYWLYFAALFFFLLSSYSRSKASYRGEEPPEGTLLFSVYSWFGGGLSTLCICMLIGWGFFTFTWWVPIASLFGGLFLAGLIYGSLPIGTAYVIYGFPVGLLLTLFLLAGSRPYAF